MLFQMTEKRCKWCLAPRKRPNNMEFDIEKYSQMSKCIRISQLFWKIITKYKNKISILFDVSNMLLSFLNILKKHSTSTSTSTSMIWQIVVLFTILKQGIRSYYKITSKFSVLISISAITYSIILNLLVPNGSRSKSPTMPWIRFSRGRPGFDSPPDHRTGFRTIKGKTSLIHCSHKFLLQRVDFRQLVNGKNRHTYQFHIVILFFSVLARPVSEYSGF